MSNAAAVSADRILTLHRWSHGWMFEDAAPEPLKGPLLLSNLP